MDIETYGRLIAEYKTTKETAGKVNQIFSQGDPELSDPENDVVVAGFMQNQAIDGTIDHVNPQSLGTAVLPSDPKSLAIALLTKAGYEIVATDKDLAGEVADVIARKTGTDEVVIFKCGPAQSKKVVKYLERPATMLWILDKHNRLFTFKRGPQWDSFIEFHNSREAGANQPPMSEERKEEPEEKQESPETGISDETPARVKEPEPFPEPEPETPPEEEEKHDEPPPREEKEAAVVVPETSKPSDEEDDDGDREEEERAVENGNKRPEFFIGRRKLPRILKQDEIASMLRIAKGVPRDFMLLQCMYFMGMSNAEIQNLEVKNFNFRTEKVHVSEGKNRRSRNVPIPKNLIDDLKAYIGLRTEGFLLRGRDKSKRLSDRHIRRIVKAYAKEAGVPNYDEIHPHTLRHSYATHLLDDGVPLETVQSLLGHEGIETTAIYSHAHSQNINQLREKVEGAFQ
jgi:hypothetical protein